MKNLKKLKANSQHPVPDKSTKYGLKVMVDAVLKFSTAILILILILAGCSKKDKSDSSLPGGNNEQIKIGNKQATFTITSKEIKKTATGYEFEGALSTTTSDGQAFNVGTGFFNAKMDSDSNITSISGTGIPAFPNVGIFKKVLGDFNWEPVKSHIDYNTGAYYKSRYGNVDIPLTDDRYYLHYMRFDESKDEEYGLRQKGNNLIYNFYDMYVDINDPAIFFKLALWTPKKGDQKVLSVADRFWNRINDNLTSLGKNALEFAGSEDLIVGISNHGTFKTPEYELGFEDSETFKELYGFDDLESLDAHLFFGVKGVEIPKTVILQVNGQVYRTAPLNVEAGNQTAVLDWLNNTYTQPKTITFSGNIDFGGKGLQPLLLGVLPAINEYVGRDIFNEDIDIVLADAFLQDGEPALGGSADELLFRMGGHLKTPFIADLFGDDYAEFIVPTPGFGGAGYFYLNVPADLAKASIYNEEAYRLFIPNYGELKINEGHFIIDSSGINFRSKNTFLIEPIQLSRELTGKFSKDGYQLSSTSDNDITLPNGVVLISNNLDVGIGSIDGILVDGNIGLPFGSGNADVTGKVSKEGLYLNGSLNSSLTFDGVTLPVANGHVTINPAKASLDGKFTLPTGLGEAQMAGGATSTQMRLDGYLGSTVTLDGSSFHISNSSITASTKTGVSVGFYIDLGPIITNVNGKINPNGTFLLTGSNNFARSINFAGQASSLRGIMNVRITNAGIDLSGTGTVSYIFEGPLGGMITKELYSGPLIFKPNWPAGTIEVCAGGFCTPM